MEGFVMSIDFNTWQEPKWLTVLREQKMTKSLKQIANDIGYSTGAISAVLSLKYKGDLGKFEQAVKGAYMGETVSCPVLGELERNKCLQYQRQGYSNSNPLRIKLFRACPRCNYCMKK